MRNVMIFLMGLTAVLPGTAAPVPGPRLRVNFNDGWRFERQSRGAGELGSFDRDTTVAGQVETRFRKAPLAEYDDTEWQRITLPHTWNAQDALDEISGYWRGIGWYRKHFKLEARDAGRRVFLEFEGVNHVAEFWLNGKPLGVHKGGYTSFEFDITPLARFNGQENVLTVKVDNLYHDTVPPTVKTDYTFYGGIYRDVWLRISEPVYVERVDWSTPAVTEESASLRVRSRVDNRTAQNHALVMAHEVLDPEGRVAASWQENVNAGPSAAADAPGEARAVARPRLWSPDSPNLYTIRTTLREGARTLDVKETPLGFRWFRFDPQKGFFLNGKRVQLQGTNWHQSYPGMGNALPNSRHWKDMQVMRDMGVNFWRTSHYPHDPATIEASDRLGLMVWEELPVNKEIGDPNQYIANVEQMGREMIGRDRNNPSIIMWGIAGEINAPASISKRVVSAVAKLYRELDPSRPVVMHAPRGEEIEALVDITAEDVGRVTDAKHAKFPERVIMTGEFSVSLMGRGIYDGGRDSEDGACERHERHLAELNRRPWMAGACIWHQFDYDGESYDNIQPHVVAFGMADIWRIPKEVYYFYQSQWTARPMVHIVGHWTWPGQEGRTRAVKVYSNAGAVELFLNGKPLGPPAKSDYPNLEHPPLIWNVPYQFGTLRAVAKAGGKEIVDERKTAGRPAKVVLQSDALQLVSGDPESLAYITASVTDEAGTVVPDASHAIAFTSYGPGELLPQAWIGHGTGLTWNAVAGMTRVALRATPRSGDCVVSAYVPGLKMGRVKVKVTAPGKPDEMNYKERFDVDEVPGAALPATRR
jgi:beta-galactosidase